MELVENLDRLSKRYTGLGLLGVAAIVVLFAGAGAAIGILFPKYQATATLQFPAPPKPERGEDKAANVIDLTLYKRVAATYGSTAHLSAYLESAQLNQSAAAARLL